MKFVTGPRKLASQAGYTQATSGNAFQNKTNKIQILIQFQLSCAQKETCFDVGGNLYLPNAINTRDQAERTAK